ncbi:MAG TPA: RNA 2',3'-cyclic phosphodiesterase [Pyrinomonadaceae bacterium]|nr:RNA 2',3'-cyclic phosphodiesterase [Pyrinomonadaceae bacterium]
MSHEEAQKTQKDWRVFCAIELPAEVRARLDDHILTLRKEVPAAAASWSRVENIHLTLKFFGNVEVKRIACISEMAERVVKQFSTFQIGVGETGVFPRPSRPQVLWIGVSDPSGQLSALQEKFENECAAEGFEKENRAYRPHLTIARLRKPEGAQHLADTHLQMKFDPIDVELKELVVFRSELSPKGSKYTVISAADLRR